MRLAICDLGTNSIRLDIYELHDDGDYTLLSREKRMVRLGEDVYRKGKFSKGAIKRTMEAFKVFHKSCKKWSVDEVKAIATSAMREAANAGKFSAMVLEDTAFDLEVISGRDEALLILEGISLDERIGDFTHGFIDIGGGSTEVGVIDEQKEVFLESLPLGAVRLKELFFESGYGAKKVGTARQYVRECLVDATSEIDLPKIELMLGSSGTMRTIQRLLGKNGKIKRKALSSLIDRLLDSKDLDSWPELSPGRADIIIPGAILAQEIMIHFRVSTLHYTDYALRDGLLIKTIEEFSQ